MGTLIASLLGNEQAPGAVWEQNRWPGTVNYRTRFAAPGAAVGALHIAAVDSYAVYLNGVLVAVGTKARASDRIAVELEGGTNDLAVAVSNRGAGQGSGLMAALIAGADWGQLRLETTVDHIRQAWYWSAASQQGDAWTQAAIEVDEDWSRVQQGQMDRSGIGDPILADVEVIAGFPNGIDQGAPGALAIKRVDGENLALGKVSNRGPVVDGRLNTSWNPPINALNFNALIDLERRYFINKVRVVTGGSTPEQYRDSFLRGYSVQVSDDQVRWNQVGVVSNPSDSLSSQVEFRPLWSRYVRLVISEINAITQPRIAEIEVYGSQRAAAATYTSPPLDLGYPEAPKNFGRVHWRQTLPAGSSLALQFRSGSQAADFAEPLQGWSAPLAQSGDWFPAAEPGVLLQYRVHLTIGEDGQSPVFAGLSLELETEALPLRRASGRVEPNRVALGQDTAFVYTLDLDFAAADAGVARVALDMPAPARLERVDGLVGGNDWQWRSTNDELQIDFAPPLTESTRLVLGFHTRVYGAMHAFGARLWAPNGAAPLNVAQNTGLAPDRDQAYSWLVTAAAAGGRALFEVGAEPSVFSPNGDGINDATVIGFSLAKLNRPTPVRLGIFDLGGRPVRRLVQTRLGAGSYQRLGNGSEALGRWDGLDQAGVRVPPGIYVYRIDVELDTGAETEVGVVGVAY